MTNQDVVPYNAYLLKRFRSHINVEKIADIRAVKYIYKYIYKGLDKSSVRCVVTENGQEKELIYDEAGNYLDARYLSSVEACWRIFKFPLQGKSHSVVRLPVHLEDEQMIYFNEDDEEEAIIEKRDKKSKLLAYFEYLKENPDQPRFLYPETPKFCVWDAGKGKWKTRKRGFGKTIGRMYPVGPNEGDKYYLRHLLLHTAGQSYEDLKTFEGTTYQTFAKVCLARSLIRNDDEWFQCMNEAIVYKLPAVLRSLFASILLFGNPENPENLWDSFKDHLAEDFLLKHSTNTSYKLALSRINKHLNQEGKALANFATMPQEIIESVDDEDIVDKAEELKIATEMYEKYLNAEQKAIYEKFEEAVRGRKKQMNLFVDGPGGTGKSYLLQALFHLARAYGKKMVNMAFSGKAATLLKQGRTIHNRFKFPLNLDAHTLSAISRNSKDAIEILETDFFVIDEAPMTSRFALEAIDKLLKELTNCKEPFGGKSIILCGDFRQTLPVKKFATRSEIVNTIVKKSIFWKYFVTMKLTENIRAIDKNFAKDMLTIGDGRYGENGLIDIPKSCILPDDVNMVEEVYGDVFETKNYSELNNRMILSPYNEFVDAHNVDAIEKFPGEYITYLSIDETENNNFPVATEILNSYNAPGFPSHELKVKINCKLVYLRNTAVKDGLCNGTHLQLIEARKNVLRCIILGGEKDTKEVFIYRITLLSDSDFPFVLKRHQFPVKLAFAATIIKGQGSTYKKIGIDWTRQSFSHGQTYVCLLYTSDAADE